MYASLEPSELDWLCGPEAAAVLAELAATPAATPAAVAKLRRHFSPQRAALLVDQAELRKRGEEKFPQAARMFFTPMGLQQATDAWVAAWKVERFPQSATVYDLCCGIGGDLGALAQQTSATGVDLSPVLARFALENAAVCSAPAKVLACDATRCDIAGAPWHIDPDRRPQGRRTTRPEFHSPSLAELERMLSVAPDAAIKLAPAAEIPIPWAASAELEWISRKGQCRQVVAWHGGLARQPGHRRATALGPQGAVTFSAPSNSGQTNLADRLGRWVYDPDPALLAAGLLDAYSTAHGVARVSPRSAYLTGPLPGGGGLLTAFEVEEVLPLREKQVAGYLAARGVGRLEVKHRGVELDPEAFRKRLRLKGTAAATLLVTPTLEGVQAIVAQRVPTTSASG